MEAELESSGNSKVESDAPLKLTVADSEISQLLEATPAGGDNRTSSDGDSADGVVLDFEEEDIYTPASDSKAEPEAKDKSEPAAKSDMVMPDGSRIEIMAGGRILQETVPAFEDGSGTRLYMFQMLQEDGGKVSRVRGMRPENKFNLTESADGKLEVTDEHEENSQRFLENPALAKDRQAVLDLAEQRIDDPLRLAKFKADMIRFENRAQSKKMPDSEITDTYKALGRLLKDNPDATLSAQDRSVLAQQVITQAAHPVSIDQGQNKTCNVSNAEVRIYARQPSKAADLVADVAETGGFTGTNGKTVKLPAQSLVADREARMNPPLDGSRSYATQLFNHVAANLVLNEEGKSYIKGESRGYGDTGERVVDSEGKEVEFSGFDGKGIIRAHELIVGESEDTIYIQHEHGSYLKDNNLATFGDAKEFRDMLVDLKEKGQLPVILSIDTGIPPFENGDGSGSHVVTVHDIDADTGKVKVDNQWGSSKDFVSKPVDVDQLYHATSIQKLRNDVIEGIFANNKGKHFDHNQLTVLETLRGQHGLKANNLDSGTLAHKVVNKADRRYADEKQEGNFDPEEYRQTKERIEAIYQQFGPLDRLDVLWGSSGDNHNVFSDSELAEKYAAVAKELNLDPALIEAGLNSPDPTSDLPDSPLKKMIQALDMSDERARQVILARLKRP